eukprot:TRINITY_DN5388_c0_g2_i1.p1 TRINITY_DN5388_c0_g2~~TRINITY_DN5388_c0_g2_i1.p1  ORF type:complete len:359 (+),score=51.48 TRINITY_DN5388_c0_g2_i1:262-1338(+)
MEDGGEENNRGGTAWLLAVWFCSFVVLAESARTCHEGACGGYVVWAVTCAVTGLVISSTALILEVVKSNFLAVSSTRQLLLWTAFTLLWGVGAGTMTFVKPFHSPAGNGFFASWGAFLTSVAAFTSLCPALRSAISIVGKTLVFITLFSTVLLIQGISDCSGTSDASCSSNRIYAIVVASLSIVTCAADAFAAKTQASPRYAASVLVATWAAGWAITFSGPYDSVGNGYLSITASFVMSLGKWVKAMGFFEYLRQYDLVAPEGQSDSGIAALLPVVAFGMPPPKAGQHPTSVPHPHAACGVPPVASYGTASEPTAPPLPEGDGVEGGGTAAASGEPSGKKIAAEWHFWQLLTGGKKSS